MNHVERISRFGQFLPPKSKITYGLIGAVLCMHGREQSLDTRLAMAAECAGKFYNIVDALLAGFSSSILGDLVDITNPDLSQYDDLLDILCTTLSTHMKFEKLNVDTLEELAVGVIPVLEDAYRAAEAAAYLYLAPAAKA